jgi:hypothetical protein
MKNFLKRITGIDKIINQAAQEAAEAIEIAKQAKQAAKEAIELQKLSETAAKAAAEQEEFAKLTPKERATQRHEPWVGVIQTHINKENIRNGFFELDWNEYFILQLKREQYGSDGDPDEEIIDRWFRELCANVVVDGDYGGPFDAGSVFKKLGEQ